MIYFQNDSPKIIESCTLPLIDKTVVDVIITEKCVSQVDAEKGLILIEETEDYATNDIIKFTGCPINEMYTVCRIYFVFN